jgi:FlaA1/EpsC-like NDP-sugar epimerase
MAEEVWIQSNLYSECNYAACRYGNIKGSRGAVHGLWERQAKKKQPITLTHQGMTRWFWEIKDAAQFILHRLIEMQRGVIYVPKMPGYRMLDVAKGYSHNITITGLRCGEKLHEEMISETESQNTYESGDFYTIYPFSHEWAQGIKYSGIKVPEGFTYRSCTGMTSDVCPKNEGREDMDITDILEEMTDEPDRFTGRGPC